MIHFKTAAVHLCAGSGNRMRGRVGDKILAELLGKPVIAYSVEAMRDSGVVQMLVFVCRDAEQVANIQTALKNIKLDGLELRYVMGGKERQDSVWQGLIEVPLDYDYVFIHDSARPLVTKAALQKLHTAVVADGAAVLAHRVTDTIKKVPATKKTLSKRDLKDVPRANLWAMETPQAFQREMITDAYRRLRYDNASVTDDTAAAQREGHRITIVENLEPNPKLTLPEDLDFLEFLLKRKT